MPRATLPLLSLVLAACAAAPPIAELSPGRAGSLPASLEHGGRTRSMIVHVPKTVAGRRPLLIALHGGGSSGAAMEEVSAFSRIADRESFFVVYPDGIGGPHGFGRAWNAGHCCGLPHFFGVDDTEFVGALIDELAGALPIDRQRIFVVGYSNGGLLALSVASHIGERLAGVAIYAASLPGTGPIIGPDPDLSPPAAPLSAILVHSWGDPRVPYHGEETWDRTDASFRHTGQFFAAAASCPGQPERSFAYRGGMMVERYRGCRDGTEVRQLTLFGWNHEWPSHEGLSDCKSPGEPLAGFDAGEAIWRFFSDKRRALSASPAKRETGAASSSRR